jgi:hypothetical protein
MGSTVSNQKLSVCTEGTDHKAIQTAPDVCRVPGVPSPVPFPNTVETTKLAAGKTTKTFIKEKAIWTAAGELGPPSDPGHAGRNNGVGSGTYRDVARPTSYSPDVFAEGKALVRLSDTTTQNRGNAPGAVVGSAPAAPPPDKNKQELIDKIQKLLIKKYGSMSAETMKKLFDEYDKNKDGNLDDDELTKMFEDADIGGKLTRWKWVDKVIEALDTGKDKKISWDEFWATMK